MSSDQSFIKRAMSRSFLYGASNLFGKAIGLIMLPIYTRYLTPADYGIASFLLLYIALVQIVLGVKLESAISKFYYDKDIDHSLNKIITTANCLTAIACVIPVILSIIFSDSISNMLFGTAEHGDLVAILAGSILFGTLELYNMQYIRIKDKAFIYLSISLFGLILQLLINIVFIVFLEMGVVGVIVSNVAASFLKWALSGVIFLWMEGLPHFERTLVKPLFRFCAPLWMSGIFGLYAGSSHQVFINYFSELSDLGLYNLGATLASIMATLVFGPFWAFWQVERFKIKAEPNALLKFRNIYLFLLGIGCVMSIGISSYGPLIIELMADNAFHPASKVVAILCVSICYTYLATYAGFSFLVTGNTKEIARTSIYNAAVTTILLAILVPFYGFLGASIAVMLSSMFNFYYVNFRSRLFFDMQLPILLTTITMSSTLIASVLLYFLYIFLDSPVRYFIIASTLNSAVLLSIIFRLKRHYPDTFLLLLTKIKLA